MKYFKLALLLFLCYSKLFYAAASSSDCIKSWKPKNNDDQKNQDEAKATLAAIFTEK